MEETYRILKINSNDLRVYEKKINRGLESLQEEVDGLIEVPYISDEFIKRGIDIVINEEGKLRNLKYSIALVNENLVLLDLIAGPVFFIGNDNGRFTGLTDEQIEFIKTKLKNQHFILETENSKEEILVMDIA
ncbi:DUF3846 domain-containing protein [Clostridium sp.]|uniref:DUF3846 domain-containing protein n=1 Tax=Clostridium sp. TaxID=1506 RepID=UPI001B46B37A|nr:DUF3846 domain-containing protein [Clostridium sp.]MBP3916025.1 DUF3846 domain-containing protein [Clostridium sp.]